MSHFSKSEEVFEINTYQGGKVRRVKLSDPQHVCFPGYDMGTSNIKLVETQGKIAVFKVAGHSSWCGRGDSKYYPPYYMIGTLNGDEFTELHNVEYTRKNSKQASDKMKELVKLLLQEGL